MPLDLDIICSGSLLIAEFNSAASDIIDVGMKGPLWDAEFSGELADAPGLEQFVDVIRVVMFSSGHPISFSFSEAEISYNTSIAYRYSRPGIRQSLCCGA